MRRRSSFPLIVYGPATPARTHLTIAGQRGAEHPADRLGIYLSLRGAIFSRRPSWRHCLLSARRRLRRPGYTLQIAGKWGAVRPAER